MLTKYDAVCFRCHKSVPAGKGDIQKTRKKGLMEIRSTQTDKTWLVRCFDCKGKGNTPLPPQPL